jgi:superfamily II DNA or RNA helicase
METENKNKYINLKVDGKLFPSWIMKNFKKYKLEKIIKKTDDPCNSTMSLELRNYQLFLSDYFNKLNTNILIYHGLGSGKTRNVINIYNTLYNTSPQWNIFLLIKASLHEDPWLKELTKWLSKDNYEERLQNIYFVHYDAPNVSTQFQEAIYKSDTSKQSLFIIEEAHNFIRNVNSNMKKIKNTNAKYVYDYIIKDQLENNSRVICISGTPVINIPFELGLLFNLLRPNIFPNNESEFNNLFIRSGNYKRINELNKNMFQRRILGLVSYYIGSTPDYFASKKVYFVDVMMSKYHTDVYDYFEEIERKLNIQKNKNLSKLKSSYNSYTRQACNFVFPQISNEITGETRPRPSKFKINDDVINNITKGKIEEKKISEEKINSFKRYMNTVHLFLSHLEKYFDKIPNDLNRDIDMFINKYNSNFKKFVNSKHAKSKLFNELSKCSSKMINIIFNMLISKGPLIIYSNYVHVEGFQIFKLYLKYFGFLDITNKNSKNGYRYSEYHGGIKMEDRRSTIKRFNKKENKFGEDIKIIMISSAGAEGIGYNNVRQVHIMEPYWNEVRIEQIIGRAIRYCSHKDLAFEERHVDVYRYKSVKYTDDSLIENTSDNSTENTNNIAIKNKSLKNTNDILIKNDNNIIDNTDSTDSSNVDKNNELINKNELTKNTKSYLTTDQRVEDISRSKNSLLQSFLDTIKEASVDCELFKPHNMLNQNYKCFQFEEPSLFNKYIGPAYKKNITDDKKIDNGLNNYNSSISKIKVFKIKAVIQLVENVNSKEKNNYSDEKFYWINFDTHVIYDYELKYPIGKIKIDNDNVPIKLNNEIYIIDKLIPIPIIT